MAQDRTAEQREPRDRPPEIQPPQADLAARLERLPIGHPSSPYHDDGSRKPSPPDLSRFELPHPDESDSSAESKSTDHPRTAPDGSWKWKGRELTPERALIADEAIARCRDKEGRDVDENYDDHGLTPAMRRIESQLDHGRLIEDTEKFALKEPDRFKEKLAKLIERYPGAEPRELAASIADGIRYTVIFDFDHYTAGVAVSHKELSDAGYERIETKPSWDSDQYKGVNSQWREPSDGVMFEVQFHTEQSWDAKQQTHDAYEKIQEPGTSVAEVERLRDYQRWVSDKVRIPQGALDIEPYRKDR